ncbi:MAG: hypothetical protein ABIP06_07135 [Pyrinomonadaceae bacterium]
MIDQSAAPRYARTNPLGYYRFAEVAADDVQDRACQNVVKENLLEIADVPAKAEMPD